MYTSVAFAETAHEPPDRISLSIEPSEKKKKTKNGYTHEIKTRPADHEGSHGDLGRWKKEIFADFVRVTILKHPRQTGEEKADRGGLHLSSKAAISTV